jgi:hypothetical protein
MVHGLLPDGDRRLGKLWVSESSNGDTDNPWTYVSIEVNRAAASGAKIKPELSARDAIADEELRWTLHANLLLREVCADVKYRAGSPLTGLAMTGQDHARISRRDCSQRSAMTLRDAFHRAGALVQLTYEIDRSKRCKDLITMEQSLWSRFQSREGK